MNAVRRLSSRLVPRLCLCAALQSAVPFAHQPDVTYASENGEFSATRADQNSAPPPALLPTDRAPLLSETSVPDTSCTTGTYGCSCPSCSGNPIHQFFPLRFPDLFVHGKPNDPGRYIGKGEPLRGTSWLNRPCHAGWFMGGILADERVEDRADVSDDFFGGYRFGWDFDHYWGTEMRLGFARLDLRDNPGVSSDFFWDLHLLRYPWGDSRWRPFGSVGIGTANFRFIDNTGSRFNEYVVHIPIGFGMKYYYRKWLVFRAGVVDNIAIGGSGLDTMHNISLTGGVEIRFGGWRRGYYPWNPSMVYW